MINRIRCAAFIVLITACGKPVDATGHADASFTKATMGMAPSSADPNRPLAADLAILPLSMLVMYNRLHTADKLQAMLNRKPGQFSRVDIDKDGAPDPLAVDVTASTDGHAVVVHAKPPTGQYVVATLVFDPQWEFLGHYSGLKGGAASTVAQPLLASGTPTPPVAAIPPATPATVAGPSAVVPASTPASAPNAGASTPARSTPTVGVAATP